MLAAVSSVASTRLQLTIAERRLAANGRAFDVKVVRAPLAAYGVKIGLAGGRVGMTAPVADIARRYRAVAAINGCFFDAYTRATIKPPYHHLITDGDLVHIGNTGTTLGFSAAGDVRMDRVRISLLGGLDGQWTHPANWYAYFVNHPLTSTSAATLYTSHWAYPRTPAGGIQVVVRSGGVRVVAPGVQWIPRDGYVLVLTGRERYLATRFRVGRQALLRPVIRAKDPAFWEHAQEAIECGPRLLRAGEASVDALAEGFSHPKIVSLRAPRSAVGVSRDGSLLLVATSPATMRELAGVMRSLGAEDAMNLDGGASSGLWAAGRYLKLPGRAVGHAILVVRRPTAR